METQELIFFSFLKDNLEGGVESENRKIYVDPLGVLWKALWWRIKIALKETLVKQKVSVVPRDSDWLDHSSVFPTWVSFFLQILYATKLLNAALQKHSPSEEEAFI